MMLLNRFVGRFQIICNSNMKNVGQMSPTQVMRRERQTRQIMGNERQTWQAIGREDNQARLLEGETNMADKGEEGQKWQIMARKDKHGTDVSRNFNPYLSNHGSFKHTNKLIHTPD